MTFIIEKPLKKPLDKKPQQQMSKIGFWATVTEVNSMTNTCTVLTSNQETIRNLPIASSEWISDESFERNMPVIGSFVFCLIPNDTISSAFVLCSGYPKGETSLQKLYASDKSEKERKDIERERITPGQWNEKEDYDTGTRIITSPDNKIEIKAELKNRETQSFSIKAFDHTISINKDGVSITAGKDINISTDGAVKVNAKSFNFNDGALEIDG